MLRVHQMAGGILIRNVSQGFGHAECDPVLTGPAALTTVICSDTERRQSSAELIGASRTARMTV